MTPPPAELREQRDTVWWYAVVDAASGADALDRLGDPALRLVRVGPLGLIVSSDQSALAAREGAAEFESPAGVDENLARVAVRHDQIVSGLAELVPALVPIRF